MHIHDFQLHQHTKDSFNIEADTELYWLIVNDMIENAGSLAPRLLWQNFAGTDVDFSAQDLSISRYQDIQISRREMKEFAESAIAKYSNLSDLLDAWLGPTGTREVVDTTQLQPYRDYLSGYDSCRFFDVLREYGGYKMLSDFLTTKELAILDIELQDVNQIIALEIGGGYGRLAEAMCNVYGKSVTYIMSDSVPISLMYSYLYLKKNLPNLNIGIYYLDKGPPASYDIYIIPAWHLEEACVGLTFDLLINIQSMQEMSNFHVNYYLNFFDLHSIPGSVIYLNNNKDYVYQGKWVYPEKWLLHFRHPTPWSWSPDCPVEVFIKTDSDNIRKNQLADQLYKKNMKTQSDLATASQQCDSLNKENSSLKAEAGSLTLRNSQLESNLMATSEDLTKEKEAHAKTIDALEVESHSLKSMSESLSLQTQKLEHTRTLLLTQTSEAKRLEDQINALRNDIDKLTDELNYMQSSISWTITKPLRWLRKSTKK